MSLCDCIFTVLTAGLKLTWNRPVSVSSVSSGSVRWVWQICSRPSVHSVNSSSSCWSRTSRTCSHFWRTSSASAHPRGLEVREGGKQKRRKMEIMSKICHLDLVNVSKLYSCSMRARFSECKWPPCIVCDIQCQVLTRKMYAWNKKRLYLFRVLLHWFYIRTYGPAGRGCSCLLGCDFEVPVTIWGYQTLTAYSSPRQHSQNAAETHRPN